MIPTRALTALTLLAASPIGLPDGCGDFAEPPADTPDSASEEYCPPTHPQEGCACPVEGEMACEDDGLVHETAFVCVGGVWTDLYGSSEADALFCGHPDLAYNYCAWVGGEVMANCTIP